MMRLWALLKRAQSSVANLPLPQAVTEGKCWVGEAERTRRRLFVYVTGKQRDGMKLVSCTKATRIGLTCRASYYRDNQLVDEPQWIEKHRLRGPDGVDQGGLWEGGWPQHDRGGLSFPAARPASGMAPGETQISASLE